MRLGSGSGLWQKLWTEDGVIGSTVELQQDPGVHSELKALTVSSGEDSPKVSMVSRSFRPKVLRTQKSRSGSEQDSEQNWAVRFLQTLLLICVERRDGPVWILLGFLLPSADSVCEEGPGSEPEPSHQKQS